MPFGYLTNLGRGVQDDFRAIQPHKELRANRDFTAQAIEQAQAEADRRIAEEDARKQEEAAAAEQEQQAILARLAGDEFAGSREREQSRRARSIEQEAVDTEAWDRYAAERDKRGAELVARANSQGGISESEWQTANAEEAKRAAEFEAKHGRPPAKSRIARDLEYRNLQGQVKGDFGSTGTTTSRRTGGSSEGARSAAEQYLMGQWSAGPKTPKDTRRDLYVAQLLEERRPDVLRQMVGVTGSDLVDQEIRRRRGLVGADQEENDKIVAARIRAAQGVSSSAMSAEVQSARTAALQERGKLKNAIDQAKLALAQGKLDQDMRKFLMSQAAAAEQRALQNLTSLRNARAQGLMADIYYGTGKDANAAIAEAESDLANISRVRADMQVGLTSTSNEEVSRALGMASGLALDPQLARNPVMTDPTLFSSMGLTAQQELLPGSVPKAPNVTAFAGPFSPSLGETEWGRVYITGNPPSAPVATAQPVKMDRRDVTPPPRRQKRAEKAGRKPEGW